MATTDEAGTEQCRALTEDGVRCSRPAQEDGFCYQHDESDPTVDEQEAEQDGGESEANDEEQSANEEEQSEDEQPDDEEGQESNAESDSEDADSNSESSIEGPAEADEVDEEDQTVTEEDLGESESTILGVRRTVEGTATGLIGQPLDSITEVMASDDGWRAVVEVVERSSVPDTQDILGQYEVELSEDVEVKGYRRIDRYRRSDTEKGRSDMGG